jgi:hypothetical protein
MRIDVHLDTTSPPTGVVLESIVSTYPVIAYKLILKYDRDRMISDEELRLRRSPKEAKLPRAFDLPKEAKLPRAFDLPKEPKFPRAFHLPMELLTLHPFNK